MNLAWPPEPAQLTPRTLSTQMGPGEKRKPEQEASCIIPPPSLPEGILARANSVSAPAGDPETCAPMSVPTSFLAYLLGPVIRVIFLESRYVILSL